MDLKELQTLAEQQIAEHGLSGWSFRFGRAKRRLGMCDHRSRTIEISAYYAYFTPDPLVKDTLLHELAHALAGAAAGHGPKWKAVARRLGATPKACDSSAETVVPPGNWQAKCAGCGHVYQRYRRPRTLSGYRCRCSARSPLTYAFRGKPGSEPPPPPPTPWQATCAGCGTTHARARRPKAGLWSCRCPARSELKWVFMQPLS